MAQIRSLSSSDIAKWMRPSRWSGKATYSSEKRCCLIFLQPVIHVPSSALIASILLCLLQKMVDKWRKDDFFSPTLSQSSLDFCLQRLSLRISHLDNLVWRLDSMVPMWGPGIPYTEQVSTKLDYDEFSGTRLMPSLTAVVCALTSLISFQSFIICILVHWRYSNETLVSERPYCWYFYWSSLFALVNLCLWLWWLCLGASCLVQYKCHGLPFFWWHTCGEFSFILVPFPFYSCIPTLVLTTFPSKFSLLFRSMRSLFGLLGASS